MADYELVEMLLGFAIPRRDVRPLARGLMAKFGGVHQILFASIEELMAYPGVGPNTAIFLKSIHKIISMDFKEQSCNGQLLHNEKLLCDYCRSLVAGNTVEECHVLYIGANKRLIKDELHSRGTINWTAIYPKEILKRALSLNATFVVMVHNHPSGIANFSEEDKVFTDMVKHKLAECDIVLIDHLVVANGTGVIFSASANSLLK